MKDTTRENPPDSSGDDPLASYTLQQRRAILKGLRILARVAIRSYMREHAEQAQAENSGEDPESYEAD